MANILTCAARAPAQFRKSIYLPAVFTAALTFSAYAAAPLEERDTLAQAAPHVQLKQLRHKAGNFDARLAATQFAVAQSGLKRLSTGALAARRLNAARALADLRRRSPGTQAQLSASTATPELVSAGASPLSDDARGRSGADVVRAFLHDHAALYGLNNADINGLAVLGESISKSGLRMVRVEQNVSGKRVFMSETRFVLDANGRLWRSLGALVPQVAETAAGVATLSAEQGLAAALDDAGMQLSPSSLTRHSGGNKGQQLLGSSDGQIAGDVIAELGWFPLSPGMVVPAWRYIVFTSGDADWNTIVDARSGATLWRKDMRANASTHDARFRVYTQADGTTPADSPSPLSPTNVTPGAGTQGAAIAPTIVAMQVAYSSAASPNGWIDDCPGGACTAAQTQTFGNNVNVCMDLTVGGANTNACDTTAAALLDGNGRPTGNPDANSRNRDFLGTAPRDFQTNFLPPPQGGNPEAGQTATGNGNNGTLPIDQLRRGVLTNAFYTANWFHDQAFALGFDEASGNFQATNFSGNGLGNDRVNFDVDDGSLAVSSITSNADFISVPPDGTSSRVQTYRYTGPTIDRDGALDNEVVLHELAHGLTNRLIGNGAGLNWAPGLALGEGWSDFYALALLNNSNGDNPSGNYAFGSYSSYKLGGLLDNYLYGIRRFPYSTDNSVNPLTWGDVDDVANDLSGGIAPDPLNYSINGGMDVHNAGELWALSLWEVRSRIIADAAGANGDVPTGNHSMLQLVTDALKMTPVNPGFIDARDALLAADCATNACTNETSIWGGFSDRGLGYGASVPYTIGGRYVAFHLGVHESFSMPVLDVVNAATDVTINDTSGNNNGAIDPDEPVNLSIKLTNPWRGAGKAVGSATATLTSSTPGVTIVNGTASYGSIAPLGSATGSSFAIVAGPTCASAIDFTLTTVSSLGTTATNFRLRIGMANGTDAELTYTNATPVTILDTKPRGVKSTLTVSDDLEIAKLNFRLDNVTHPGVGDLAFLLRSPTGMGTDLVTLIDGLNDVGGTSIINMLIDGTVPADNAHDMVQASSANAPYTGAWSPVYNAPWAAIVGPPADPVDSLSRYAGASTQGTWTALAADDFSAAAGGTNGNGSLNGWSLLVTPRHFDCAALPVDLSLTQSVNTNPVAINASGGITYSATVHNNSASGNASSLVLTETLAAGLSYSSFSSADAWGCSAAGQVVTCSLASLSSGNSSTVDITADTGATAGSIKTSGHVSAAETDPVSANNNKVITTQLCDPAAVGTIGFGASSFAATEGAGPVTITVNRSSTSCSNTTVNYATVSGGSAAAADFTATSGNFTWLPLDPNKKTFVVPISNDSIFTGNRNVNLQLSSPSANATLSKPSSIISIRDDEVAATVGLSTSDQSVSEEGGLATVTATLSVARAVDTTVPLAITGTANKIKDYSLSAASILIPAGQLNGSVTLTGLHDLLKEDNESAIVKMGAVSGATTSGTTTNTIIFNDDDATPTVSFDVAASNRAESKANSVNLVLSAVSGQDVTVSVSTTGGTATPGADYTINGAGTVTILAGATTATAVTITDDTTHESSETAVFHIDSATNAAPAGVQTTTLSIIDNDP